MTMPNFLIIGAMKSGTTALYHYLRQHPQIYMSPKKEPRFFALEAERLHLHGQGDQIPLRSLSSVTDIGAYQALFRGVSNEVAIGEASHWYLYSPRLRESEQHYIPELIKRDIPDVKLIALLRNPAERAYSQFLQFVRSDYEPLTDFAEALREEETRELNNWPYENYVSRGFYYDQLKRYFDRFADDQIRIYLYEDLNADPVGVLKDIFEFLRVDETFTPNISVRPNTSGAPKNKVLHAILTRPQRSKALLKPYLPTRLLSFAYNLKNQNLVKPPPLTPEVRRQLVGVYREDILKLQELINRDLSRWLE